MLADRYDLSLSTTSAAGGTVEIEELPTTG